MRVKACCGGVQMFKKMSFVILFDVFLNPSFKMAASFANVARTTASASKEKLLEKTSNHQEFGLNMQNNF